MNDKIKKMSQNIGSLCIFLKNDKNKEYLNEILNNIPIGLDENSMSEKIYYYVNEVNSIELCGCGKMKKFIGFKNGWRETCGDKECVSSSRKETCLDKFGVDNPKKSKYILEKEQEKIKKNWGGDHYMMDKSVRRKLNKTMNDNWGVDWAQQSNFLSDKSKETWDRNPKKDEIIEERRNKFVSLLEHKKEEIIEKRNETIIKNWGNKDNLYKHITNKVKERSLEKWGTEHHLSSKEIINKRIISYQDNITNKILEKLPGNIKYISRSLNDNKTDSIINIECDICLRTSNINRQYLKLRIDSNINPCLNCNPILSGKSGMEIEISDFIRDNYKGEIITNTKNLIDGFEIDIYLPNIQLAIEFNGLYWHSDKYKDNRYHLNKTNLCKEKSIYLIHVWEDDWIFKKEIVKSIILNKLNNSIRIAARKCDIKELENKEVREFLNENHIQGFVGSKIKYGLFYENELVSLMTFGNLRKSLNQKSSKGKYELLRFCNKKNTTVIGGASKLFKHFIKNNDVDEVISYSDSSRSNGGLYEKLGFNLSHDTEPNYYWIVDGIRKHRFNYRKDKLVSEGYDKRKTEIQIMNELGYNRIFDCGSKKWTFKNF